MDSSENSGTNDFNKGRSTIPIQPRYGRNSFSIDRSSIPTAPKDDQNDHLYRLGVDIYEQEALEKEILHQVDKALERQNLNKIKATSSVEESENIDNAHNNCLKRMSQSYDDYSNVNFLKDNLEEHMNMKKIRMGEMTPFGTSELSKSSELNCYNAVEKYLKTQIEAERKNKSRKKGHNDDLGVNWQGERKKFMKNSIPLKKFCLPRKKRKVAHLGSISKGKTLKKTEESSFSEEIALPESSCSEYFPSESDFSDTDKHFKGAKSKRKKRKMSRVKNFEDEDELNTDDSDWEYSDCETKIKAKSGRKEEDDGNIDQYLRRLSVWEKYNNYIQIETEVKSLEGGFKVPLAIWNKLFNYQKVGVQWLWELHSQRCGGILGDEMGLGKTIQVIAFFSGLSVSKLISKHGSFKGLGPVLIICPTTVMHQWVKELHQWWPQFRVALMHESGNYNGKKSKLIQEIVKSKGILITSFSNCVQQIGILIGYLWHYVVIDEGHKIRNPDSQITKSVKQLRTPHRIILSGSPLQNNLKELWSLFDFIFPGKLGTLPVFMSEFAVPITQGGYTNATQVQVATAFKCATVLRDTISPFLLRRVKEDVKSHINLPMKNEQVLFCKLTDEQRSLYLEYLNSREVDSILSGRYKVFVGLINLRKICNHPHLFSGGPKIFKWDNMDSTPEEDRFGYWKKAGKMIVVETLLKIWKRQDHRVLIFTQSKQMLNILEYFVQSKGYEYLKLDGTTSIGSRQPLINKFNEDMKYFVFLSTTHVGGLGVNLTGADRVVIYDPDWNPATDTQARERAWRIGQNKQVTIYRLITSGTIEEKIYHRQIFKQFLTNKVLKDPKQRRFFKSNDLYELFTLKDNDNGETETSALFAGMKSEVNMRKLRHRIVSTNKIQKNINNDNNFLSEDKIEKMRKLAKLLSQRISNGTINQPKNDEVERSNVGKLNSPIANHENSPEPAVSLQQRRKEYNFNKKKKEHFVKFEGEIVSHLTKQIVHKECGNLENENRKQQDEYILRKLFSKSEIKSAMLHDRIMGEGPADYALVEGEAEKVAKEAVRALKESRKQYFQSVENISVVTKPRFGSRSKKKATDTNCLSHDCRDGKSMSSSELLSRIKERNRLINNNLSDLPIDHSHEQLELLSDIRNFISFQGEMDNVATTQEIINRFRDRIPEGASPLFRALLLEICEFHRDSGGRGMWRLRQDFRW